MTASLAKLRKELKILGRKIYIDLVVDLVADDLLDEFDAIPRDLPPDTRRSLLMNLLDRPRQEGSDRSLLTLIEINARRIEATEFPRHGRAELAREFADIGFDNHRGVTPHMLFLYRISTDPAHPDLDYLRKQYLFMNLRDLGPTRPPRRGRIPAHIQ